MTGAAPSRPAWRLSPSPVVDLLAAALVTTFLILVSIHIPVDADARAWDPLGYSLLVAAGACVALCRRRPGVALAITAVLLVLYIVRHYTGGPIYLTGWVALVALALRAPRRVAFAAALAFAAVLMVVSVIVGGFVGPVHLVFLGWSAAAVLLGDVLRNRRTYLTQLEERNQFLERTREEEARRRIAEERLRIARDLHDSVAHAMATISVQAGAAAHVVDRRPEAAKAALTAIRQASGEVLDELSALLGVLRDDSRTSGTVPDITPEKPPSTVPGLESVAPLVEATRSAGLPVTLCVDGPVEAVNPHRGQAAYRIVQEALTNVLRHTGPSPTRVLLRADQGGGLCVQVVNERPVPGAVPTGGGAGLGIRGMRERAAAAGGALRVGPDDNGGFTVEATWPAR